MGLEGIVSKRLGALPERAAKTWIKTKALRCRRLRHRRLHDLRRRPRGSARSALGEWVDGELQYRGKVGTGFDAATCWRICCARLEPLEAGATKLDGAPKDMIWVRPVLTAHIHYANRTADNALRHAVFKGLRDVELSTPVAAQAQAADLRRRSRHDLGDQPDAAAVRQVRADQARHRGLLRRGRRLHAAAYPRPAGVAGALPDRAGRRTASSSATPSPACRRRSRPSRPTNSEGETKSYISVEDAKGYLALAQFGVVEFHAWGCTARQRSKSPTASSSTSIPGEGIAWREVVEAAVHVRGELEALGLVPFVKTSGGKGIHVVVPIKPKLDWKKVHPGDRRDRRAHRRRRRPTPSPPTWARTTASRRIFIDFHRNARSATAAAPYSLRARTNLPASTPRELGGSGIHRRSGGFELFFAAGSVADVRRSLGGY